MRRQDRIKTVIGEKRLPSRMAGKIGKIRRRVAEEREKGGREEDSTSLIVLVFF